MILLVLFKILAVITIIGLTWVIMINPLFEIEGLWLDALGFVVAAYSSLLLFKAMLFCLS